MKTKLVTFSSALVLALAVFSPVSSADVEYPPGNSTDPGNRIVCFDFEGVPHQSPGLCAQAVGEFLGEGGFKGGPGQAWKWMRDNPDELPPGTPEPSNAHDCISMNCGKHAGDL